MPRFRYIVTNLITKNYCLPKTTTGIITLDDSITDVHSAILRHVLQCKRKSRHEKLLHNFTGDLTDVNSVVQHLPPIYKCYVENLEQEMASMYEIVSNYEISDIELMGECNGCINE